MISLLLMFATVNKTFHLPPGLLESVCWVESNHRVSALREEDGGSASMGVCQVKYDTAKMLGFKGTETDLMKPRTNVYYAGKYLAYQLKRYDGDIRKAVSAYNMGTHRENSEGLTVNRRYVSTVFRTWAERK